MPLPKRLITADRRTAELCSSFIPCVEAFEKARPFSGPSIFFHQMTLDRVRQVNSPAAAATGASRCAEVRRDVERPAVLAFSAWRDVYRWSEPRCARRYLHERLVAFSDFVCCETAADRPPCDHVGAGPRQLRGRVGVALQPLYAPGDVAVRRFPRLSQNSRHRCRC